MSIATARRHRTTHTSRSVKHQLQPPSSSCSSSSTNTTHTTMFGFTTTATHSHSLSLITSSLTLSHSLTHSSLTHSPDSLSHSHNVASQFCEDSNLLRGGGGKLRMCDPHTHTHTHTFLFSHTVSFPSFSSPYSFALHHTRMHTALFQKRITRHKQQRNRHDKQTNKQTNKQTEMTLALIVLPHRSLSFTGQSVDPVGT